MTTATKERPIIFSGEMVCAILDGRKTQTRRVIKPQPPCDCDVQPEEMSKRTPEGWQAAGHSGQWWCPCCTGDWQPRCPYGVPSDRLWIREAFVTGWPTEGGEVMYCDEDGNDLPEHVWYRADLRHFRGDPLRRGWRSDRGAVMDGWTDEDGGHQDNIPWKPSIHMPRWASRILLEITNVRVERVQKISESDAYAEGITEADIQAVSRRNRKKPGAILAFWDLWNSINAKRGFGWDGNPWVWVITFKRVEAAR